MADERERERHRIGLVRLLLRCLLVMLAVAAALGLWAILVDKLDGFPLRIFLFSLATAGYSVIGLGCAVPLERDLWKRWASVGIAVTLVAYLFVVALIFVDLLHDEDMLWWFAILTTWSVAFSHTSLLTLARLEPRYKSARTITSAIAIVLAMLLTVLFLNEFRLDNDEIWGRALAALGLLVAMGTLAVPILHRMSGLAPDALPAVGTIERIELYCPRCHRRQFVFLGGDACERCGLRITAQLAAGGDSAGPSA